MSGKRTGRYKTVEFECKYCHHSNRKQIDLAELGFEERNPLIQFGMRIPLPCENCGRVNMVPLT